jgi:hypothetical protein
MQENSNNGTNAIDVSPTRRGHLLPSKLVNGKLICYSCLLLLSLLVLEIIIFSDYYLLELAIDRYYVQDNATNVSYIRTGVAHDNVSGITIEARSVASVQGASKGEILFESLAEICGCHGSSCFARCGIDNCWNRTNQSVSLSCSSLFESSNMTRERSSVASGRQTRVTNESVSYDAVLDFHCDNRFAGAIYHNLIDCFMYQITLIVRMRELFKNDSNHSARSVAIVAQPFMMHYMEIVCNALEQYEIYPVFFSSLPHPQFDSACLNRHYNPSVGLRLSKNYEKWFIFRSKQFSADKKVLVIQKKIFFSLVAEQYLPSEKCQSIVLILRKGSREFIDEDDLVGAFRSDFGHQSIDLYRGNETFVQTVRIFSQACAVIGYHGAGGINIFYTRPGTLCIEITTYTGIFNATAQRFKSSSHWNVWRSNKAIVAGLNYLWQVKLVEHHHLQRVKVPLKVYENDSSHIVKYTQVMLTREHIEDLIWRVETYLSSVGIATLTPSKPSKRPDVKFSIDMITSSLGF